MREVVFTSFGAFRDIRRNPSILVAQAAAEVVARAGRRVSVIELPVTYAAAAALAARAPAGAFRIHVGVAATRPSVTVEQWARPESGSEPDVAGALGPVAEPFAEPRVSHRASSLVRALLQEGEVAALSDDAGGYVCNALLYASLQLDGEACFVHVPLLDDAAAVVTGQRLGGAVVRLLVAG